MREPNHDWVQGIGFEIKVDIGVSEEKRLECEQAIANILLADNDKIDIHNVGRYNRHLQKVIHSYRKNENEYEKYYE